MKKKRKLFELLSDEHIAFAEKTIKESFADYFEMEHSIRRGEQENLIACSVNRRTDYVPGCCITLIAEE